MQGPMRSIGGAAALVVLSAAIATAQVCRGTPGFDSDVVQVAGSAALAHYAGQSLNDYTVELSAGRPRGVFGAVAGALERQPRGYDGRALQASIGTSIRPVASRSFELCPVLGASRQRWDAAYGYWVGPTGPVHTIRLDQQIDRLAMGASLGGRIQLGVASLLPFMGATYVLRRDLVRFTLSPDTTGMPDRHHTDAIGVVRLGAGLSLGRRVTIQPRVDIPVGIGASVSNSVLFDSRTSYGVQLVVGVGR